MGQPVNATFGSVVFLHLLHSGGTTLRQLFSQQLCDDGYGLRCWEGRGRGIPAPAEARRPLDALYGHFPFQPAKFAKVTTNPFYLTVLADPWDVLRSGYFHMKLRKDERRRIFRLDAKIPAPEAWARETFPEGLAAHLERLAGVDPGVWVTGTYACDAALANLPRFHFLTEKDHLRRGGLGAVVAKLRELWPEAPLSADVPDRNRFASNPRSLALAAAFDADFPRDARDRFENASHTACTRRVLAAARALPAFWRPSSS